MSELLTPVPAILWKRKWLYLVNLKKITECQILKTEKKDAIIAALLPYLPTEVPRGETV